MLIIICISLHCLNHLMYANNILCTFVLLPRKETSSFGETKLLGLGSRLLKLYKLYFLRSNILVNCNKLGFVLPTVAYKRIQPLKLDWPKQQQKTPQWFNPDYDSKLNWCSIILKQKVAQPGQGGLESFRFVCFRFWLIQLTVWLTCVGYFWFSPISFHSSFKFRSDGSVDVTRVLCF
jgi:hypothetical protein